MTKQASFSELEYTTKKKVTRRDRFLDEINKVTPWAALVAQIEPFYPKGTGRGRPPIGVARMLRMYIAQQCFGLSDEGIEDAIYDSQAIRGFVGIDLSRESAPDATTLLKFRRLLETHQLTERIFETINALLAAKGLILKEGTVVDATIIAAPSSTKNRSGERDPEMHQTKKGNQWYFGMKAHIGVDAERASCIPWSPRQPTSTMSPRHMPCCMAKNGLPLAMQATKGLRSGKRTGAGRLNGKLPCVRVSARRCRIRGSGDCRSASNRSRPASGPRLNIRSGSSRTSSA